VGNGVADASGVFVIAHISNLLSDVRDWLSGILERLDDVCDLLNDDV
jgi:hypothetical protein